VIFAGQWYHGLLLSTGERNAIKLPKTHQKHKSKLIPKPKGTAGHKGPYGYNLIEAMGLEKNKNKYTKIRVRRKLIHRP
jgi:hypothetical protein